MGHIELAAPVTHIWYFKGVPSRLGYLLDLAPKDLEKIIYFAAYLITAVNDEERHRDLPTLEAEVSAEKSTLEKKRDSDVEARAKKLETDLAELEAEGAKSDVRRKVREGGEREMRQIRDRAQREIDRLDEVMDTFRKLEVKQLISDELLSYSANSTTANYAIVKAGRLSINGQPYPSIAFLNRGARPVQLIVTLTGYYDDDTFWFGERYTPTAPVHLGVANPLYAGGLRTINPGAHAHPWTTAMNLKIAASAPTLTTSLALWPRGIPGIGAPAHGQLHANAHQSTIASTPVAVGINNRFFLRNAAGRTSVNLWSFGTFEAWPAPSARSYASDGTVRTSPYSSG
jgi:hypothetical protein